MATSRGQKEAFARFFEEPTRDKFRSLLREHSGETELLDFKESWPKHASLAKHVLGFSNTGNGCIVVGVRELPDGTLESSGMEAITDKARILDGLKAFLPNGLLERIDIQDFHFEASEYPTLVGKRFQVLFVEFSAEHVPFISSREGEGIKAPAIYIRRAGQTTEANHDEVQRILNKRIETRYSTTEEITLKQHLEQLRVLYSEKTGFPLLQGLARLFARGASESSSDNFDAFVRQAIAIKKRIVLVAIGATPAVIDAAVLLDETKLLAITTSVATSSDR